MVVNWKAPDANERLWGSLLVAHPEFKIDYARMARIFGRGATYNSVEGQFRKYREVARKLASDAPDGGDNASQPAKSTTPRTPRSKTNGVTKPGSGKKATAAARDKTAKSDKSKKAEALTNAICLGSTDSDGDLLSLEGGSPVKEGALGDGECKVDSQINGYVQALKDDDAFGEDY